MRAYRPKRATLPDQAKIAAYYRMFSDGPISGTDDKSIQHCHGQKVDKEADSQLSLPSLDAPAKV